MRTNALVIKGFPPRIKEPLELMASRLSAEYNRRVSVTELVINACNAYIEKIRADTPELLKPARFTRTRDHDLILEAVAQGLSDVDQITGYVNRARRSPMPADGVEFLLEDLIGARLVKRLPQAKPGKSEAPGNVQVMLYVRF